VFLLHTNIIYIRGFKSLYHIFLVKYLTFFWISKRSLESIDLYIDLEIDPKGELLNQLFMIVFYKV